MERGLKVIIRKTGEKWTPSHVLQALHESCAGLFVCEDGFAVLQRTKEEWTSEPYVNVWALWMKPGRAKEKRQELVGWLDRETEKAGCRYWKFGSPRQGWGALEDSECEIERIIWRRKNV